MDASFTVIVGCGSVGMTLAARLAGGGRDLVIIDRDESSFEALPVDFAGRSVCGDGTSLATLRTLEVERASTFVAVTCSDTRNVMAAQIASKLFGVPQVLARIRNPDRIAICKELGVIPICSTLLVAGACVEVIQGALGVVKKGE